MAEQQKYNLPYTGQQVEDLLTAVPSQSEKNAWNAKYTKPAGGIPKTDLASDVQTSINKANSALQSVPVASASTLGGIKVGTGLSIEADGTLNSDGLSSVSWDDVTGKPEFATVATSGSYNDLSSKPAIPTKTSDLNNDSNFVADNNYVHTDNNYTSDEKTKLSNIASGAEVNVQSDWEELDSNSDAFIKNKPTIPPAYVLPTASDSTLGGIKVGTGLTIADGILSTTGGGGSQNAVLYTEQSLTSEQQTQARTNIGAGTSSLVIDSSHKLSADLVQDGTTNKAYTATEQSKLSGIESGAQVNVKPDWNASAGAAAEILNKPTIPAAQVNSDWNSSSGVSQILNKPNLATVATSGSYNDLQDKPTIPDAQIQSDWNQSDNTKVDYIKNKPTIPSPYTLPPATTSTLGGVIVGTGLTVGSDGTIAVTGSGQSVEWNDVANKPTTISGYGITDAKITSGTITLGSDSITPLTAHQDISGKADKVSGGTENNFAALDSNGNLKDSGHKHGDYQTLIDSSHKLSADLIEDGTTNKVINVKPNWNVSSGDAAEILNKPTLGTAAAKDYTSSVTDGSSDLVTSGAVYTAIDNLPNPMVFKGSLGTGGTITSLPVDGTATVGDTYKVITAGTYASQAADIGDTFICDSKTSSANTWVLIPSGDEPSGTVTSVGISQGTGISVSGGPITSSGNITVAHDDTSTQASVTNSGRTYIQSVTLDGMGHVTALSSATETVTNTDTHRPIQVNGTQILGDNTTALNLKAGTNITLTNNSGEVTIAASGSSAASVTDNNPTLSWGAESKVATIDSTDIHVTMPANPASGKADKVSSATNGNFAGLDSNGNLTDSGKKASDFQTALSTQTAYTSKGSATKVPQITTNTLGQVTGITEVTITQPDVSNLISKSNTAGLVKNDGTIDTNTYLTSAPVTSVNNQTGAVSLNIPSAPGTLNTTATTAQSTNASEALSGSVTLHKVAKTGTYSDLIGTPTIPTVNNSTITLQANGSQVDTFTTNASSGKTINLGNYLTSTTSGLKIEVVASLPASPDSNTIYIVQ